MNMNPTARHLSSVAAIWLGIAAAPAGAADLPAAPEHHDHQHMHAATGHEGHDMSAMQDVKLSLDKVVLPALSMTRQDGTRLPIAKALDDGRPVILNFIFTTCTAICPVLSQTFADLRGKLGDERSLVNMVSISIDPDYDTPQRLKEYAAKFGADANWNFYTGALQDSIAVQKAFASYRGDKMNHAAVTFMRARPGQPWLRVDGFASPSRLLAEYRKLGAQPKS
jgi:protein SCO1/2